MQPSPMQESRPAAPATPYVLPSDSGLVMVETASDRKPAPVAEEESTATSTAPRRVRPPRPTMPDEPLVFVETTRKQ